MTAEVLLVLHDFVQGDLVLDQQRDLDVQLIDILLRKLVLSHVLNYGLAQTFKF